MTTTATTDPGDRTHVRLVLAVLVVLAVVPVFTMALGVPMMAGMGWHGGTMVSAAPWWGVGMGLVWLAVLLGIGYLVFVVVGDSDGHGGDPALRELRLAYARGDLTDEEFEARRAVLADDQSDDT